MTELLMDMLAWMPEKRITAMDSLERLHKQPVPGAVPEAALDLRQMTQSIVNHVAGQLYELLHWPCLSEERKAYAEKSTNARYFYGDNNEDAVDLGPTNKGNLLVFNLYRKAIYLIFRDIRPSKIILSFFNVLHIVLCIYLLH